MTHYEYKVVPAPKKGARSKGVKGSEARFARTLEAVINEMAAEGWEYQRTDTLPSEERSGFTGKTTVFQNMLIFRRAKDTPMAEAFPGPRLVAQEAPAPLAAAPEIAAPVLAAPAAAETASEAAPESLRADPPLRAEPPAPRNPFSAALAKDRAAKDGDDVAAE